MKIKSNLSKIISVSIIWEILLFASYVNAQNVKNKHIYEYDKVDVKPEFEGGETVLLKYLKNNTHYPQEARDKKISGTTFVKFIVNEDGSVQNPEIVKSANALLDAEALRVITTMPKWVPGKHENTFVSVSYLLPIKFVLAN